MMDKRYVVLGLASLFFLSATALRAQSPEQLISDLQVIHRTIRSQDCASRQVVSNRAMNLFLSDKIGSYLTTYKNLSFYKNYVTFNMSDGVLSLNHNFFQASGTDEPVRSFYVAGVKANVASAFISAFTNKSVPNELGIVIKKAWIGKPRTILTTCSDKNVMDVKRESILLLVEQEIKKREDEFLTSLSSTKQEALSDSIFAEAKKQLKQKFYVDLSEEFSRKFASFQYRELVEAARYKRITTHWTNLNVYLPIVAQRFAVAKSYALFSETKKNYPFELSINHTRFWETKKSGRFFLTVEVGMSLNNSIQNHSLESIDYDQYKTLGGIDTTSLHQRTINTIFIGDYKTFLTPVVKASFIYYPPDSHIGVSTTLEQNMGVYKALNWTIGIPIVLINKADSPASNFEFQLRYFDITHAVFAHRNFSDAISINLTIGIPFSKIIY